MSGHVHCRAALLSCFASVLARLPIETNSAAALALCRIWIRRSRIPSFENPVVSMYRNGARTLKSTRHNVSEGTVCMFPHVDRLPGGITSAILGGAPDGVLGQTISQAFNTTVTVGCRGRGAALVVGHAHSFPGPLAGCTRPRPIP